MTIPTTFPRDDREPIDLPGHEETDRVIEQDVRPDRPGGMAHGVAHAGLIEHVPAALGQVRIGRPRSAQDQIEDAPRKPESRALGKNTQDVLLAQDADQATASR